HKMTARLRTPRDAVGVDIAAADADTWFRHGVKFGKLRLWIEAQESGLSAKDTDCVPDRAVFRIWHYGVGSGACGDAGIFGGIARLSRVGVVVTFTVAVGVENERRPAGRFLRVVG